MCVCVCVCVCGCVCGCVCYKVSIGIWEGVCGGGEGVRECIMGYGRVHQRVFRVMAHAW